MASNETCAEQKNITRPADADGYRENDTSGGAPIDMAKVEKRPEALRGFTYRITCGCGTIYVTINENDDKPFEVFINFGKSGKCANITLDAIAITISHGLRAGVHLEEYMRAFRGYSCELRIPGVRNKGTPILSCVDAVAQVFQRYLREKGIGIAPTEGKKITDEFSLDEEGPQEAAAPGEPATIESQDMSKRPSESGPAAGDARKSAEAEGEDPEPIITKVMTLDDSSPGAVLDIRGGEICESCGGGPIRYESGCDYCMSCGASKNCGG